MKNPFRAPWLMNLLDASLGDPATAPLEKRILNAAILATCSINFIFLLEAILFSFSKSVNLLVFGNFIFFLCLYFFSRFFPRSTWPSWLYLFVNFCIILIDWLFVGGLLGVSRSLIVMIAFLTPFILPPKQLSYGNFFYSLFLVALFLLSFTHFDSIQYIGKSNRIVIEALGETGVLLAFILIIANIAVRKYRQEKHKVLTLNDHITESNLKLKMQNDVLSQLDEAKNNFFSIISHDLRGPLGAMHSLNELLLENYETMSDEQRKELLFTLVKTSKNTFGLLENLLDWTRAESGNFIINNTFLNFRTLVQEVCDLLHPLYQEKKVSLQCQGDHFEFNGDANILKTILRNLLSNALKFTPSHGKVTIVFRASSDFLLVSVNDEGIGMPPEVSNSLFDVSTIKTRRGTANEKGSGIGLILCKQLADKIGAELTVRSELNKGSSFQLKIPLD